MRRETRVRPASDPAAIAEAVALLRAGELVVYPTDTVYGLGAHAFLEKALLFLYTTKGRPSEKAIPLLLSDGNDLSYVAQPVPDLAWVLAKHFWPGALTLVVPKGPRVLSAISPGPSVAVRVPNHPVVLEMIRSLGAPLTGTSANLSGQANPVTAQDVLAQLGGRVSLILDDGPCRRIPSTVLDLTCLPPRVLRAGSIPAEALEEVLGMSVEKE